MNHAAHMLPAGEFDDPWRRLPWVFLAALLIWASVLGAFARLLEWRPPPPEIKPVEAQLIEVPPPTAGLQGGPAPASPPVAHPAAKPEVRTHPIRKPVATVYHKTVAHRPKPRALPPPEPDSPSTGEKTASAPATSAAPATTRSGADRGEGGGVAGGTGVGSGSGIGSDASGARAIYAPMPVLPDDLRANPLNTVAVASFRVATDGSAQVTLVQPTAIPRLNQLLLQTLRRWRFFPAVNAGQPAASEFEVRIPIVVR